MEYRSSGSPFDYPQKLDIPKAFMSDPSKVWATEHAIMIARLWFNELISPSLWRAPRMDVWFSKLPLNYSKRQRAYGGTLPTEIPCSLRRSISNSIYIFKYHTWHRQ